MHPGTAPRCVSRSKNPPACFLVWSEVNQQYRTKAADQIGCVIQLQLASCASKTGLTVRSLFMCRTSDHPRGGKFLRKINSISQETKRRVRPPLPRDERRADGKT